MKYRQGDIADVMSEPAAYSKRCCSARWTRSGLCRRIIRCDPSGGWQAAHLRRGVLHHCHHQQTAARPGWDFVSGSCAIFMLCFRKRNLVLEVWFELAVDSRELIGSARPRAGFSEHGRGAFFWSVPLFWPTIALSTAVSGHVVCGFRGEGDALGNGQRPCGVQLGTISSTASEPDRRRKPVRWYCAKKWSRISGTAFPTAD